MSKRHDKIFDDVLSDLGDTATPAERGSRFLKRSTTIGERLSGDREEKTLFWVDPRVCRMWERHNRDYALLTEENCRDLIDGIRAQGRQEFPAVVRRIEGDKRYEFEVICGARRHFAVSWLRANTYPQFKYLIDVRDLTDEEAFRLADIENREREDISDYERATDYADALERYYGGRQKTMAERLEVSPSWLSRYLYLAELPQEIVTAFPGKREIRERHARELKPLLSKSATAEHILEEARSLSRAQRAARGGQGASVDAADVVKRLKRAARPDTGPTQRRTADKIYRRSEGESGIVYRKTGRKVTLEFDERLSREALLIAFHRFVQDKYEV